MTTPDRLDQAERDKLARICGRLSSDFDGERAVAARIASEFIRARGLTWDALIAGARALAQGDRRRTQGGQAMSDTVRIFWAPEWQAQIDHNAAIRRLEDAKAQFEASEIDSKIRALWGNPAPLFTHRFGEVPSP